MKLLIASDLHGSHSRAESLAGLMRAIEPEALVLLGDLLYHGPRNPLPEDYNPAAAAECLNAFSQKIVAVAGNCDSEVDQMVLTFDLAPRFAWIFADGIRIQAAHGHLPGLDRASAPDRLGPKTAFLSGHTHVPEALTEKGVRIWNPGSLGIPKNGFPPSCAVYEKGVFRVTDLSGNILMENTAAV